MKKVLYITNIQVPYRIRFFNELSKRCSLTVLYERSRAKNRDAEWSQSIKEEYERYFLDGIKIGNESTFSLAIVKYLLGDYDVIILGCYSTPIQIFANLFLRLIKKPFIMNFDGEVFANDESLKSKIKKMVIRGADSYLIAGEKAAANLKKIVGGKKVTPYFFSSLSNEEIQRNASTVTYDRENFILVVGQYFAYKGLDIAVEVAKELPNQKFEFVGMGKRTELFEKECNLSETNNIKVIPFMRKEELFERYRKCKCLLLPSRQECWGLVVNEAISYGTPVVSTYGSGAAVEFLDGKYSCLLAKPGSVEALIDCLNELNNIDCENYSKYLLEKVKAYSIERSVEMHLNAM